MPQAKGLIATGPERLTNLRVLRLVLFSLSRPRDRTLA